MATLALTDIQHCPLSLVADDGAGNPTTLPAGAVTWASSNTSIVTVTPSADGMSADVASVGPIGTAQVSVSVTTDPAQSPLTGTLDVSVGASAAATIQIVTGTPVAK
jgi:hypothetical protein